MMYSSESPAGKIRRMYMYVHKSNRTRLGNFRESGIRLGNVDDIVQRKKNELIDRAKIYFPARKTAASRRVFFRPRLA